jgi:hypothetical protein
LEKLKKVFRWEVRVLIVVPVGVILRFVYEPAAYLSVILVGMGALVPDGLFSITVAKIFLRPILQALRSKSTRQSLQRSPVQHRAAQPPRSTAHKLMARVKWATFTGIALAVVSSSVLYLNLVLWALPTDTFQSSPWLNPLTFMVNAASILKDVSMLLVSGLLTSASLQRSLKWGGSVAPRSSRLSRLPAELCDIVNVARAQLQEASEIPNETDMFLPPQAQARCLLLKTVAKALQKELFQSSGDPNAPRMMDHRVAKVIENDFVMTAHVFFSEVVEEGVHLVAQMRAAYHGVRYSHLGIYKDTLDIIRSEASFLVLQRRSEDLVLDCTKLDRPRKQSSTTITDLYESAEAISKKYESLMSSIASKTGATFHKAPQKGLVRVVEKMALSSEGKDWKPELLCDIVRGALECKDFATMITTERLLRDLDPKLFDTGQTGDIEEKICITRAKNRFGNPTSGGWADFMVNFYFEDDGNQHICELQLVHSQMFGMRKNMGAHKTYAQFRGAKEILEMLGLNPEEGADPKTVGLLKDLVWTGQSEQRKASPHELTADVEALQAEVETLKADMRDLKQQNALILAQLDEKKNAGNMHNSTGPLSTITSSGEEDLPVFASSRRSADGEKGYGQICPPRKAASRVFQMPSWDRNIESFKEEHR